LRRKYLVLIAILTVMITTTSVIWVLGLENNPIQVSTTKSIPSPEEFFGYSIGDLYKLTYWAPLVEYLKLVDALSDRVVVQEIGRTAGGRPIITVIISDPENIAKLDYYRDIARRLSDPRITHPDDALYLAQIGKPIVYLMGDQHSPEVDHSEASIQLVYELATRNDEKTLNILKNVIIVILPSANPDGHDVYRDWYYTYTTRTPYIRTSPPIWGVPVSHDNNRDWHALNLYETQVVTANILYWKPQILVDNHQTSVYDYRMYIPPENDNPINPNIHPIVMYLKNLMGGAIAVEMLSKGLYGIAMHVPGFDLFAPVFADTSNALRNIVSMTWEMAGYIGADPMYIPFRDLYEEAKTFDINHMRPWPGGWWSIKDQVKYRLTAWWALLENVALNKHVYLYYTYVAAKEQVELGKSEPPYAFIIPQYDRDPAYLCDMISRLIKLGIEVRVLREPFTYKGVTYPTGTYVVLMDQPYRGLAKTLLEVQELKTPYTYDISAWTYGYMWNLPVIPVDDRDIFAVSVSTPLATCTPPKGLVTSPATYAYILNHTHTALKLVNELLRTGFKVQFYAGSPITIDSVLVETGAVIVPVSNTLPVNYTYMKSLAEKYSLTIYALNTTITGPVYEIPKEPKIALYWPLRYGRQSMDAGWISIIFKQYNFSYDVITCENITTIDLSKYNVIIIPDESPDARRIVTGITAYPLKNGIGTTGLEKLKAFVNNGGTLILLNRASGLAILYNITPEVGFAKIDVSLPGSILRAYVNTSHFLAYGVTPEIGVFHIYSPAFTAPSKYIVATYADEPRKVWMSGYIEGEDVLAGKPILLDVPYGNGRFIMFGFNPVYRAQSTGTYLFFFNAIYYSVANLLS